MVEIGQIEEIDFNPELFNDIYFHLESDFNNEDLRYIFLYGGSSASKTYTVVQQIITRMLRYTENTLILRKFGTDIKDSIYSDFKGIIESWELGEFFTIQQNLIICNETGSYVRFRGLDDSEKVKGISLFKRVVLEEISQFDEIDLKQIRKRLRGMSGQQIVGIFNPVSEDHWLKKKLFDVEELEPVKTNTNVSGKWLNKKGNFVVYKLTYLNNKYIVGPHFIDKHVIEDFEKDKETDLVYYEIYGLGNWGRLRTGGEFWKDFNPNKHVKDLAKWDPNRTLHVTWDNNVNPYITCEIWQVFEEAGIKVVRQIDEICLEDPQNKIWFVCNEFKRRYPSEAVKEGVFIYGDRTSIKEDNTKEKGENWYTDIIKLLAEYRPSLKMPTVNPSVVKSAGFVNEIYAGRIENINIEINRTCKKSIFDYTYALEDSEGKVFKKKVKHPVTGVTYEEFGHCSDAKRYFIAIALGKEYYEYLAGRKGTKSTTGKNISKNGY